jgi:hypothetical protein
MQQPFNQPGGSYGNAPYAAPPPPKRGFNWLTCCLGCLGIAVVLAIIIYVFVAKNAPAWKDRLERASGPAITAANYKSEFPPDVPVYPGLVLDATTTKAMRIAGGFVPFIPKARGAKLRLMAFHSAKGIDVLGPWYKGKLAPKGWSSKVTHNNGTQWGFAKGERTFFVHENDKQPGMLVFGVGTGLPKDGSVKINP